MQDDAARHLALIPPSFVQLSPCQTLLAGRVTRSMLLQHCIAMIDRHLTGSPQALAVVLCREVQRSWGQQTGGRSIGEKAGIIVCTFETANAMLNRALEEDTLDQLSAIVVDELHMVSRGSGLKSMYGVTVRNMNLQAPEAGVIFYRHMVR